MALNKFMHPRNIYKIPPDFAKLAESFKEFSEVAKVDVTGKVSIDFKNPNALRVLTKCLLKSDFNIDIEIPEDRLVPTLPLRLNYILWLEDLLDAIERNDSVRGLDIGTGACAIYPILAAVKNKWFMVGTESDEDSLKKARDNIERNNLQDLIQVRKNDTTTVLNFILQDENKQKFHFCMCNPPFYSTFQDLWESRSPARPPPKNGFTGSPQELITEGGELQFCRKILEESKIHKDDIIIFTTMVGHKYNLKELVLDLQAEGIKYTTTEFCQGRITRWGLAWTYQDWDIGVLVPSRDKPRKRNLPITFSLPKLPEEKNDIGPVMEKFKAIFEGLEITHNIINKRKNEVTLDFTALNNTWSNQRRKRRLMKRIQEDEAKKIKIDESAASSTVDKTEVTKDLSTLEKNGNSDNDTKGTVEPSIIKPVVNAIVKISNRDEHINVEMEFLEGTAGKEGLHQIIQYIKNNFK
ncbi:U6 small nuclear RNA (adenine-(43)-N(6))-methyltransferase [Epargyreus clarus]|uniref:U6 small nuclear RNA (adenine-(43)-N(6))-methyltransferase n=1 Tax=Epargyreus clarus TaxID=520877 RepID=UPI003C2BD052